MNNGIVLFNALRLDAQAALDAEAAMDAEPAADGDADADANDIANNQADREAEASPAAMHPFSDHQVPT